MADTFLGETHGWWNRHAVSSHLSTTEEVFDHKVGAPPRFGEIDRRPFNDKVVATGLCGAKLVTTHKVNVDWFDVARLCARCVAAKEKLDPKWTIRAARQERQRRIDHALRQAEFDRQIREARG